MACHAIHGVELFLFFDEGDFLGWAIGFDFTEVEWCGVDGGHFWFSVFFCECV